MVYSELLGGELVGDSLVFFPITIVERGGAGLVQLGRESLVGLGRGVLWVVSFARGELK